MIILLLLAWLLVSLAKLPARLIDLARGRDLAVEPAAGGRAHRSAEIA